MASTGFATTMTDWMHTDAREQNLEVDYLSATTWLWEQRDIRMDKYFILMHPLSTIIFILFYVISVVFIRVLFYFNFIPVSIPWENQWGYFLEIMGNN